MQTSSRTQDYLYDSNYTVSSKRDHQKAVAKSALHTLSITPSFASMFSSLQHYPSATYTLTQQPNSIPGLGADRRIYYKAKVTLTAPAFVTGVNRFRYFKRPLIPYAPSLGTQVVYAKKQLSVAQVENVPRPPSPRTKNASIQTMYRESTTQTIPYSPEYTVADPSAVPELVALNSLTWEKGLPVGVLEIEMIERARLKRAWEATLPPVLDQASFEKRLRMMEEMELKEWKERDDEIKRIQQVRLEVLAKIIRHACSNTGSVKQRMNR